MYVTKKEKDELAAKITAAIGLEKHIKMNFIPCMVTCLAMDQALKACDAARDKRIEEVKRDTRELRRLVKDYSLRLSRSLGDEAPLFNGVVSRFDEHTGAYQWLAELQSGVDSKNTKGCPKGGEELAAHASMATALLGYAKRCDDEASRMVSEIMGKPITRRQEPELVEIEKTLDRIAGKGFRAERSKHSEQWITVIANKASELADEMFAETFKA